MSPGARPKAPSALCQGMRSLRVRLLVVTLAGIAVALLLAGAVLGGLFREHVRQQFEAALRWQLDEVTARLEFDERAHPAVATSALSDPRWNKPYSGLYWQVDEMAPDSQGRTGFLRSRSLWDTSLVLQADALADGAVHVHEVHGPQQARLLVLERTLRAPQEGAARWRLIVAADLHATEAATAQFTQVLVSSLGVLLVLLAAAAWAQVTVGLKPLHTLQRSMQAVQQAGTARLQGRFPDEVQPLVDDFNAVLDRHAEVLERARTQAGNLAHALKTPLTVLEQAARQVPSADRAVLADLVREQVQVAQRHIDWHLTRARLAGSAHLPGQGTAVAPTLASLVRVMHKVHAHRDLGIRVAVPEDLPLFAGELQDLQEMLGNLLDNACKWAQAQVQVTAHVQVSAESRPGAAAARKLVVAVEDDGPGISATGRAAALQRGVRLDESQPGSGLGLAIVLELATLYGGGLTLQPSSTLGGLCAVLTLPVSKGAREKAR